MYNFSNYLEKLKYYDGTKSLAVYKIKYEAHDVPIKPFIRLKAKHFSCLTEDDHEFRRRKRINKNVINKIGFENNKNA